MHSAIQVVQGETKDQRSLPMKVCCYSEVPHDSKGRLAPPSEFNIKSCVGRHTHQKRSEMHCVAFLLAIWSVCSGKLRRTCESNLQTTLSCLGAFFRPTSFTLTELSSQNGSDAHGGCPQVCVMTSNMVCDCTGQTTDLSGITLINDVVPTFASDVPGAWASDLYTVRTSRISYALGFQFDSTMAFALREVELYLFFCPSWGIPQQVVTISVYRSLLFPDFVPPTGLPPLGNVTLTSDQQNCNSLTRISITTQTDTAYTNYFITFSVATTVGGIYIGEVKFSDELISTNSSM